MDKLIFCDDFVIPVDNLQWMQNKKDGNWNVAVSRGTDVKYFTLTNENFIKMKNDISELERKEKRIFELEQKVKLLQSHISLMPGGTEYLLAQQDFQNNV
jgi:hypothetical protein